jgi:hypothetical protein
MKGRQVHHAAIWQLDLYTDGCKSTKRAPLPNTRVSDGGTASQPTKGTHWNTRTLCGLDASSRNTSAATLSCALLVAPLQCWSGCHGCDFRPGASKGASAAEAALGSWQPALLLLLLLLLLLSCNCKLLGKLLPAHSCRHSAATCWDDRLGRTSSRPYG